MELAHKFTLIYNSLACTKYTNAEHIIKYSKSIKLIDVAFNVLLVYENFRKIALLTGIPKDWMHDQFGIKCMKCKGIRAVFIANHSVSVNELQEVVRSYAETRHIVLPDIEKKIGKYLGYLQPQPINANGTFRASLVIGNKKIPSQYGPQSIHLSPEALKDAYHVHTRLTHMASSISAHLKVETSIVFD
jgi:hypothetical protein